MHIHRRSLRHATRIILAVWLFALGAGVANASHGLPDLGMTSLNDVLIDAERITAATKVPLLVDIDTGWGGAFNIGRTIKAFQRIGVAAVHMEDQVGQKRCGHRPGKEVVSKEEMVDRVKAAVDARTDAGFVVMARTDAAAVEGIDAAIERAVAYVEAGADMVFPEAMRSLDDYRKVKAAVKVPVLANLTEFGSTPFFTTDELRDAGVDIALYCCGAYRAMNKAALHFYESKGLIKSNRNAGNQRRYGREVLRRVVFNPVERPSLRLSPQTGVWDWTGATALTLRMQSAMDWALTLYVKVQSSDGKTLVSRIDLPPLSQRRDDVPLLTAYFLDELARQTGQRHVLAPEAGERGFAGTGKRVALADHLAGAGRIEAAEDVEQGGLAAARGAQQHHEFTGPQVQVDAAQRRHFDLAHAVGLGQPPGAEDRDRLAGAGHGLPCAALRRRRPRRYRSAGSRRFRSRSGN